MATFCVDTRPAAGLPGEVHSTQLNQLGAIREFSVDGVLNSYIYLSGTTSTAAKDFVVFDAGTYTTTRMGTTSTGSVAIATAATIASTWGWYGYIGSFSGTVESSCVTNVPVYPLSAGRIDDAIVQNKAITNIAIRALPDASGFATVYINRAAVGSDMGNSS